MDSVSSADFKCPFCPCMFSSQLDLNLHLKAFGNVPHLRVWQCVHILLEVDSSDAGVDERDEWHWRYSHSVHPNRVRACRKLVSEHERSECKR